VPLGQAEVGSVPKSVYQLDVLFFGLIKASVAKKYHSFIKTTFSLIHVCLFVCPVTNDMYVYFEFVFYINNGRSG
jgi:hypothetical protein